MREILLVGSVPLDDAEEVFRTVAGALGENAMAIPDGETGYARSVWIQCQVAFLLGHPQLEMVEPDGEGGFRTPRMPAPGIYAHKLSEIYPGRARLRPGVEPADLVFDELGYGEWAKESYATFARLKEEGTIPEPVRFMVDIPVPGMMSRMMLPEEIERIAPAYQRGLENEVQKITTAIPADQVAIQWSTTAPVQYESMSVADRADTVAQIAGVAAAVPADIPMGYHLCYGDFEHKHMVEPPNLSVPVEMANGIARQADRPVQWFHMPVPQERKDDEYVAPLADLDLPDGSQVNLGLIHEVDGLDGTRERIEAAAKFHSDFGISTECGLGRREPATIPDLLRLHLEAAAV